MALNSPAVAGAAQFLLLGFFCLTYIFFFTYISWRLGRTIHSESDGCLLALSNFALIIVGGMVGLLIFRFPYNLLSSMFLAFILPACLTMGWVRRTLPPKRP